jgi:hypothetical protein
MFSTKNYGIGISPDSVGYISTARNLVSGNGFVIYDNNLLIAQPPFYPLLLAVVDYIFKLNTISSARILNAIIFGFIVFLSGLLFLKYLKSYKLLSIIGTLSVLVSIPLINISLMAWSESLFIFFTILYIISCEYYLEKPNILSVLLLSLIVAFACLTRYIGIVLIFTGIITILIFSRNTLLIKLKLLIIFISISALPISIWLTRNYILSGTFFGTRGPSNYSLFQNLNFTLNTFLSWYFPRLISENSLILLLLALGIGIVVIISINGNLSKVKNNLLEIGPILIFIIVYLGFLLISSTTTEYDEIGNRLMSPVFVPATILFLFFVTKVLNSLEKQKLLKRQAVIFTIVVMFIWLLYPANATISLLANSLNQGLGYNSKSWRNSKTIEYLKKNFNPDSGFEIYSNGPDAIYLLANLNAKMLPKKARSNSSNLNDGFFSQGNYISNAKGAYLVFFNIIDRNYLLTIDELLRVVKVNRTIKLEDGNIYFVLDQISL